MSEKESERNSDSVAGEEWLAVPKSMKGSQQKQKKKPSSSDVVVKVNCYHSGEFKEVNGELKYVNGNVEVLEVGSVALFEDVLMKMVNKIKIGKMWYKLPYEDFVDRKPLWENIDVNKKKMRAAGRWMKELDIFIEKVSDSKVVALASEKEEIGLAKKAVAIELAIVTKDAEISVTEKVFEEATTTEADVVTKDAEISVNEKGREEVVTEVVGDEGTDDSEDGDYDGNEEDDASDESEDEELSLQATDNELSDDEEVVEEDLEVFENENYEDQIEDEDEVYPDTDDSSGDEEEQAERLGREGLPDGVFSLRQTFNSGEEFKKQVIMYILKTKRNVVYDRWEKEKLGASCAAKGCPWSIYCSVERPIKKWMVKTYYDKHKCNPTGVCKQIKSPIIADLLLEDVRRNPDMSGPDIKHEMKNRYNIVITDSQSRVARRKAYDALQAKCNEQFARLRDYEMELVHSNPGTMTEINTTTKENGAEAFNSMYICFDALRVAWKQYCRPIICLDGTFLKGSVQGMLLTAVGRDPNNQIYPIAWAVVSVENNDNWRWFINRLKIDLNLNDGKHVTIISDMHKGLINGVSVELPLAEHRACARHIYSNLKKKHKSDSIKPLFWRLASSYNEADFQTNLEVFMEFDAKACDELLKRDRSTWCRAYFRVDSCCADTHNNHTESFNRTLRTARKKPFVQMLELIRRDAMQRIAKRSNTATKETGRFTPKARKEVAKSCDEAVRCSSLISTGNQFEIVECGNGYSVSLTQRTCVCRKWNLTGIPCRHAVCAIREHNKEVDDYISDYYLTSHWQGCYNNGLRPVNGLKFWKVSGGSRIEAPPYRRPPGRPKGKARIKGFNESPTKKKKTQDPHKVGCEGRVVHCGLCRGEGHNSRKCPSESEESRAKRRRLNEQAKEGQPQIADGSSAQAQVEDVSSSAQSASQHYLDD